MKIVTIMCFLALLAGCNSQREAISSKPNRFTEQFNQDLTGKICGNCDAYCECSMAGTEYNDLACPMFDDSTLSQLKNKDHE